MVTLGELVMILDLHRQGLTVSAIARRTGHDRKTVRKYLERGLEPPGYTPRPPAPSPLAPFEAFLRERVTASTASAMARCVLPQPGWPRKWTTSWRSMKSRPARVNAAPRC